MSQGSTQPGHHCQVFALGFAGLDQVADDALDHVGVARHVGSHVAGGVAVDDQLAVRNLAVVEGLLADLHHVVADGLGEAGGVDRDHLRVVDREDGLDGREQVGLSAEHRRAFREGDVEAMTGSL
jgi:hypothetical protein